ncbi:MAG: helix-turn-helix domain-containing protein [Clostridiales bacterium]|nr:helix-turn-helix domain-containing protein [Clostridiales bacterium]MBO4579936.1 helix-turn-helix domain-containing protein [Clostridiales bacterium]
MTKLELLANVLEYIEQHISEDIHTEDIAKACFCSRSSLEKLFRCVYNISVRDYLIRRRMTHAGKALVERPELSVLDIAVMYGYSSNEAFSRAFRQVWNQLPSDYRNNKRSPELFPRMNTSLELGDDLMKTTKFDISNLYDLFQTRQDCYFVCADIKNLIPINDISRKAGDLAIVESMRRLEDVAGENDIVFRIGGDEFVILTDSPDEKEALDKMEKILKRNGECINFEGQDIPLSLYGCIVRLGRKTEHYNELFTALWEAINESK